MIGLDKLFTLDIFLWKLLNCTTFQINHPIFPYFGKNFSLKKSIHIFQFFFTFVNYSWKLLDRTILWTHFLIFSTFNILLWIFSDCRRAFNFSSLFDNISHEQIIGFNNIVDKCSNLFFDFFRHLFMKIIEFLNFSDQFSHLLQFKKIFWKTIQ